MVWEFEPVCGHGILGFHDGQSWLLFAMAAAVVVVWEPVCEKGMLLCWSVAMWLLH